jgi:hypothetical protein
MFKTDSVITQPDDNVYIIIHADDNTNATEKYHQPGDNIYVNI